MHAARDLHDSCTLTGLQGGKLSSCGQFTRVAMGDPSVQDLTGRVAALLSQQVEDDALRECISALVDSLLSRNLPDAEAEVVLVPALRMCERLHAQAKSSFAVPLSRAIREAAHRSGVVSLRRWSSTACGVLLIDTGDTVGALQYFVEALRIAALEENRPRMSGLWNNMGIAMSAAGSLEMAAHCYARALALVEKDELPVYQRFLACSNLAATCYKVGRIDEGIRHGERALLELTPEIRKLDNFRGVHLHRNLVRLYVAAGRLPDAAPHVEAACRCADAAPVRVRIAADIAKAVYESELGHHDIALTRMDNALSVARAAPAALPDALVCAIRCEEAAGNAARALLRLNELSEHVYRSGVTEARQHIRAAGLTDLHGEAADHQLERDRARLVSQLATPHQPDGWKALQRLGAKATLPVDEDGGHGARVGALTRALAEVAGIDALQAREIGRAAEVHDIGMTAVPTELLAKRTALNDSERPLIARHVPAGAEMLSDAKHPRMLLAHEIARYHHARFDGQGYPARVGGGFIPIAARMCAIADAYDMMVCGMGGRAGKSMEEALAELRRNAGGQFDPELVDCFDEVIRSEAGGLGMNLSSENGMEDFRDLVLALKEDRGFA